MRGSECFSEKHWIPASVPSSSISKGENCLQSEFKDLCSLQVREETAEYLYLILQTNDVPGTDEAEPFLLETDW